MSYKGKGCFSAIFDGSIPIALVKHGLETVFQKPSEPVEPSPIEGYTILDSIYADGNQYAIIDYYANQNTKVEMKFTYRNNYTYPSNLFVSRTSATSNNFGFLPYESGSKKTRSVFGTQNIEFALLSQNEEHTVIKDGIYTYVDGELKATHTSQTFTSTNPMYLLMQPASSSTPLEARIYYMKIWDNGALVHDLIPALNDETGVAGLYDMVTKEFVTSETSTQFMAIYKVENLSYVENGLYADYRGFDYRGKTIWGDNANGKNLTLYNSPIYNNITRSWTFTQSSKQYGLATITTPPDDFTIEIYGLLPNLSTSSKCLAMFGGIWGYYKGYGIMGYYSEYPKVSGFIATATNANTNTMMDATNIAEANIKTKWVVRRKKETGEHTVYAKNINGELSLTETRTTASLGSNPANQFAISTQKTGSNTASDYGTGTYYAIRVYNRYLTDEEVAQNHAEDVRIYGE